ncbi:MAG: hypothetical protein EWV52_02220 [Microcystis panniformis Mp_MB_F_20051200_S6D]|nr:MAG: hypothetical protein EWV43_04560 [Microcystis panniformis Mp_MB_F_20080800_S26D]TRV51246.1 MAG: hypothetical protein EWV42_10095 [Microcystis panniformis Mp_GB_SS_20050300_S99D]TRV53210.1 MAG: hypothetical protein EWV87_03560 [Microcystis panniformis Mp_GB_SS_20050300_S99]TRV65166.1 MAG: hypothetical protein EWV69_00005 [Microcystis panniformis Mp_MB_F_20080800_S26]TRV65209.1 MAG: hypothetical protein EWV86_09540 [Microcystis panniformis Mp_MB_F_20051200_S9D]TRV73288.1 MAG: hypothetica
MADFYGTSGNNTINRIGSNTNVRLFGLNGNDTLIGGNGSDWLQGASGGSGTTAHIDQDVLLGGGGTDYYVLGTGNTSFYMSSGYATLREFDIRYDWVVLADGINYLSSRIQLQAINISGGSAADTLISLDGNGSSRLCVIIFAYRIMKCLLGKTFRTILRIFYQ